MHRRGAWREDLGGEQGGQRQQPLLHAAWYAEQCPAISQGVRSAVILANPVMINAYQSGIPANGTRNLPSATVPGSLHDVDFMVKDSKRFADSGGPPWLTSDRRATTPSAGSRATRS